MKLACAKGKFPIRKKYLPHIPKELIFIVEKCLSLNIEDRYENVLDIINDLSKIDKNLDYRYEKINDCEFEWNIYENDKISLCEVNGYWKIRYDEEIIILENKPKAYRKIRDIIKNSLT